MHILPLEVDPDTYKPISAPLSYTLITTHTPLEQQPAANAAQPAQVVTEDTEGQVSHAGSSASGQADGKQSGPAESPASEQVTQPMPQIPPGNLAVSQEADRDHAAEHTPKAHAARGQATADASMQGSPPVLLTLRQEPS